MYLVCILLFAAVFCKKESPGNFDATSLGRGLFLPETVFLQPETEVQLLDFSSQAVVKNLLDKAIYEFTYFDDQTSFYSYAQTQTHVGASFTHDDYTFGLSLEACYSSAEYCNYEVKGVSNHYIHLYADYILDPSYYKFLPEVEDAMMKLPVDVPLPQLSQSWQQYDSFFEQYGSHIVTGVVQGSRLETFSMAESSTMYTEHQFEIKSCLDLEGPSPLNFTMSICRDVTKEERKSVESLNIQSRMKIFGGTAETRTKLMLERTGDLIETFLEEYNVSTAPIMYYYTPIWQVLYEKYPYYTVGYKIGRNMEAYYLGFTAFGCSQYVDGKTVLREFVNQGGKYVCTRPADGCRSDNDCHIGGMGSVCYCYGDSCIDSYTAFFYGRDYAKVRHSEHGSYDKGINNSCEYHVGVYCVCKSNRDICVLWDQDLKPPTPEYNTCHTYR